MNILFVCAHNRFRSKVAEALFNKHNKDKSNKAKSAGMLLDPLYRYIDVNVLSAMQKKGTKIEDVQSRQLDFYLIDWADKIILAADNVNPEIFPREKLEIWKIADCDSSDTVSIRDRIDKIDVKIVDLIKRLNV